MEILENNKRALERVMPKFLEQRLAAAGVKNVFVEILHSQQRFMPDGIRFAHMEPILYLDFPTEDM